MRLRGVIVIGAILSIVVGFIVGKTVIADSPAPGSNEDPVVSKSYVDKALAERVGDLEKEVAELTVQAEALQGTINELQGKLASSHIGSNTGTNTGTNTNTNPSKPSNSGTTTPTNNQPEQKPAEKEPNDETTPTEPQGSVIGKSASINASSVVNLRSAPTTEASILKKVGKDDTMVIQKVEKDWYNVKLSDGTIGWIAGRYVSVQ